MEELDRRITQALRADEAEQYAKLEPDLPPWEMVFDTFRGKHRWLTVLMGFWMVVFMVVAVWSVVRFVQADEVKAMLGWGLLSLLTIQGVAFAKVFWWMEMQKNAIIREVKRVELQLASMASRAAG